MSLCMNRLSEERYVFPLRATKPQKLILSPKSKQWRRDHPFGFFAKPVRNASGVMDLKKWEVGVPGKEKTIWEGGLFKLEVTFPDGAYTPHLSLSPQHLPLPSPHAPRLKKKETPS